MCRANAKVGGLLVAAMLVAAGCRDRRDDDLVIRELIQRAAAAVGEKDVKALMERVAEDFVGNPGPGVGEFLDRLNKGQLRMLLGRFFNRPTAPRVFVRSIDVDLEGARARAKVIVLLAQGASSLEEIEAGDHSRVEASQLDLVLMKRDGEWWVVQASRTQVDALRLLTGS